MNPRGPRIKTPKSPEWYAALDRAAKAGTERLLAHAAVTREAESIMHISVEKSRAISERGRQLILDHYKSDTSESNNEYDMTTHSTNTEFTIDALSTESVVPEIRANRLQFLAALRAFVAASQVLDQFKRNFYYGEKGNFDPVKLKHYLEEIHQAAFELDLNHIMYEPSYEAIPVDTRVAHGIMGAGTESGELIEAMIKLINGDGDVVNMKEEVGDVHWYLSVLADALGLTTDQCLEAVIKKLKDKKKGRYADGVFTAEAAVDRDTSAERELLEE